VHIVTDATLGMVFGPIRAKDAEKMYEVTLLSADHGSNKDVVS